MSGLNSQDKTNDLDQPVVSIADPVTGLQANVTLDAGVNKLNILGTFLAQVTQGRDPFPDSWFVLNNTGASGDTIRVQLAATANDPSTPDRDLPAFDKTFTTQAGEVGDEVALATRIVNEIKADAGAQSSEISAILVKDVENAVVFVTSKKEGKFFERSAVNDFQVTTTGTASITLGFNDFIARQKESELSRSGTDPRRGILGISGSLNVQPGAVSNIFALQIADSGGSTAMNVDGSVTSVEFSLADNVDYDDTFDYFITSVVIHGLDNGVKLKNFMALNSPLTNGLTFSIQSDENTVSVATIQATREIKRFASLGGWELDIEAGGDDVRAIRDFGLTPIVIRAAGTFTTDDFFKVTVNDNLTQVDDFRIILRGFRKEP